MHRIPLYNCYWCRCAYCINADCNRLDRCTRCMSAEKFKMPKFCPDYMEGEIKRTRTEADASGEAQACGECEHRKSLEKLRELLKLLLK